MVQDWTAGMEGDRKMPHRLVLVACLVGFWAVTASAQVVERTVIDNERSTNFSGEPYDFDYGLLGLYMGKSLCLLDGKDWMADTTYLSQTFLRMQPDAIKGVTQVYLQHLCPEQDGYILHDLRAFESDEVRQGRAPFFITATYQDKKRPVVWLPGLSGGLLSQAVNVADERFIKFWLKNGIRRKGCPCTLQNWAIGQDNVHFKRDLYVVLDDAGGQHHVIWDKPFPQSNQEWADAGKYALRRIKELAPDLIFVQNHYPTPIKDMSRYAEVFEPIDGVMLEAFLYPNLDPANAPKGSYEISPDRNNFWDAIQRLLPPNGPLAYKIQVVLAYMCSSIEELRARFLAYLIFCGPNAFFDPRLNWVGGECGPSDWARMKNALGSPVEPPQSIQEPGREAGWRLWWRQCEGGFVYLNLTETTKVISLSSGGPFYDPNGNPTSVIALGDMKAVYVTAEAGDRIAKPTINPRRPGLVTGPLTITLDTEPYTSGSLCKITYTLDGSEPQENSTLYAGPFEIRKSCVVTARAFPSDRQRRLRVHFLPSFPNSATYALTDEEPAIEFHLGSDAGSEFMEHDYPVVSLSHTSAHPVTVTYQATGGTASPGSDYVLQTATLTIRPGEQHRCFYLHIVNDTESEPAETVVLSLLNPVNAVLGQKTMYAYTIEDNDCDPNSSWSEGFEAGRFSVPDWRHSGHSSWQVDSQEVHGGQYAARSGVIADAESSTLSLTLDKPFDRISFYCKVSSESGWDYLIFTIDGVERNRWSGEEDWTQYVYAISPGRHTFAWRYLKDDSGSKGSDCVWIDDLMCSNAQ